MELFGCRLAFHDYKYSQTQSPDAFQPCFNRPLKGAEGQRKP
jgi:hypothetical protein